MCEEFNARAQTRAYTPVVYLVCLTVTPHHSQSNPRSFPPPSSPLSPPPRWSRGSNNPIGDDAIQALAAAFAQMPALQRLGLRYTFLFQYNTK